MGNVQSQLGGQEEGSLRGGMIQTLNRKKQYIFFFTNYYFIIAF